MQIITSNENIGVQLKSFDFVHKAQVGPVPRNERDSIINEFTDRLEKERLARPFYIKNGKKIKIRPVTLRMVAVRLSYLKTNDDLYYLLSACKGSKNFSSMFYFLTKTSI